MDVPFYHHNLDVQAAEQVAKVLATPFLTSGQVGQSVAADLCRFFNVSHALLVNSWTNGALATLAALDIGAGDEVIVPAQTFIATANVVELVGAKPVFIDVDPHTLLLQPEAAIAAITEKTRAIIPVHLYGQMCDMERLRALLPAGRSIALIEDCAHCFEGSFQGHWPGTFSDAAIFSFYATKNIACGEGGAVITNRPDLMETLKLTHCHGMSATAAGRFHKGRYNHWDMTRLGFKANLPDLLAALLPQQIATIRSLLPQREAIARRYEEAFAGTALRLCGQVSGGQHARHLFPIHVPPSLRDQAIGILNDQGIGVTVNYRSVPTLTYYKDRYGYTPNQFPVSDAWGEGTITLPLYLGLGIAEQDHVIRTVLEQIVPLIDAKQNP